MKRIIILLLCVAALQSSVKAQMFSWGIRVGLSTPDVKPNDVNPLKLKSLRDSLSVRVADAAYGYHFGGWFRLKAGRVYLQPEFNFNSSKVNYSIKNLRTATDSLGKESFLNLDIPVMIGIKMGSFRINGGPVGHLHLNGNSDLAAYNDYKSQFKRMKFGYQAGVGLDFGKIGFDVRYEGNFSNYGDHITFGGQNYEFDKRPSRFLVSMAIGF